MLGAGQRQDLALFSGKRILDQSKLEPQAETKRSLHTTLSTLDPKSQSPKIKNGFLAPGHAGVASSPENQNGSSWGASVRLWYVGPCPEVAASSASLKYLPPCLASTYTIPRAHPRPAGGPGGHTSEYHKTLQRLLKCRVGPDQENQLPNLPRPQWRGPDDTHAQLPLPPV